jgi:hypothetical protein
VGHPGDSEKQFSLLRVTLHIYTIKKHTQLRNIAHNQKTTLLFWYMLLFMHRTASLYVLLTYFNRFICLGAFLKSIQALNCYISRCLVCEQSNNI